MPEMRKRDQQHRRFLRRMPGLHGKVSHQTRHTYPSSPSGNLQKACCSETCAVYGCAACHPAEKSASAASCFFGIGCCLLFGVGIIGAKLFDFRSSRTYRQELYHPNFLRLPRVIVSRETMLLRNVSRETSGLKGITLWVK